MHSSRSGTKPKQLRREVVVVEVVAEVVLTLSKALWSSLWSLAEVAEVEAAEVVLHVGAETEVVVVLQTTLRSWLMTLLGEETMEKRRWS